MATITLTGDTNYSTLTVANDDTIDCAGFILTLDVQSTETGIQVTSPATNGRVVFSGAWDLSTWDFFAGTVIMISTLPTGAAIKSITGGTAAACSGVTTNNGTIGTATGGSANAAYGVATNNGTVTTANGGPGINCDGINTNNGPVATANGGTGSFAYGVRQNNNRIDLARGIVGGGSGSGCRANSGTILESIASINQKGVEINNNFLLRITDSNFRAVLFWTGITCFVEGPFINGVIPSNIKTIYSLGPLSESATIASDATVIELSEGGGALFPPIGPGGLVY